MSESLNDGNVHSHQEILRNGLEKSAKEFSEGSSVLQKALLEIWQIGLDTKACCKGTIEKDHKNGFLLLRTPYISLPVDENNTKKVVEFIGYLLEEEPNVRPNISLKMYYDKSVGKSLTLNHFFLTNNGTKKMFEAISNASENMNNNLYIEKSDLLKNIGDVFEKISQSVGLNANELFVNIKNNKAQLYVKTFGNKSLKKQITNNNKEKIFEILDEYLYMPNFRENYNQENVKNDNKDKTIKFVKPQNIKQIDEQKEEFDL